MHELHITIASDRYRAMQDDLRTVLPGGIGRGATTPPSPDPVFAAKNEFIRTNNLVVW